MVNGNTSKFIEGFAQVTIDADLLAINLKQALAHTTSNMVVPDTIMEPPKIQNSNTIPTNTMFSPPTRPNIVPTNTMFSPPTRPNMLINSKMSNNSSSITPPTTYYSEPVPIPSSIMSNMTTTPTMSTMSTMSKNSKNSINSNSKTLPPVNTPIQKQSNNKNSNKTNNNSFAKSSTPTIPITSNKIKNNLSKSNTISSIKNKETFMNTDSEEDSDTESDTEEQEEDEEVEEVEEGFRGSEYVEYNFFKKILLSLLITFIGYILILSSINNLIPISTYAPHLKQFKHLIYGFIFFIITYMCLEIF